MCTQTQSLHACVPQTPTHMDKYAHTHTPTSPPCINKNNLSPSLSHLSPHTLTRTHSHTHKPTHMESGSCGVNIELRRRCGTVTCRGTRSLCLLVPQGLCFQETHAVFMLRHRETQAEHSRLHTETGYTKNRLHSESWRKQQIGCKQKQTAHPNNLHTETGCNRNRLQKEACCKQKQAANRNRMKMNTVCIQEQSACRKRLHTAKTLLTVTGCKQKQAAQSNNLHRETV